MLWFFRDSGGATQGPFTSEQVSELHRHGLLSQNVKLSQKADGPFLMIAQCLPELADAIAADTDEVANAGGSNFNFGASNTEGSGDSHGHRCSQTHNHSQFGSFHSRLGKSFRQYSSNSKNSSGGYCIVEGGAGAGGSKDDDSHQGKQNFVKSKLLSRVSSKHRRSRSAGSNFDPTGGGTVDSSQLPHLHAQQLELMSTEQEHKMALLATQQARNGSSRVIVSTPGGGGFVSNSLKDLKFPSQSSSMYRQKEKAVGRTKMTGKKLLSVVTTPRYTGVRFSKYGRGLVSNSSSSSFKDREQEHSEQQHKHSASRRLPTFSRLRLKRSSKNSTKSSPLRDELGDDVEVSDRTLDEDDLEDSFDEEDLDLEDLEYDSSVSETEGVVRAEEQRARGSSPGGTCSGSAGSPGESAELAAAVLLSSRGLMQTEEVEKRPQIDNNVAPFSDLGPGSSFSFPAHHAINMDDLQPLSSDGTTASNSSSSNIPLISENVMTDQFYELLSQYRNNAGRSSDGAPTPPGGASPTSPSAAASTHTPVGSFALSSSSFTTNNNSDNNSNNTSQSVRLAELADENSQMRTYIRQLHGLVAEKYPDASLPPEPVFFATSATLSTGRQNNESNVQESSSNAAEPVLPAIAPTTGDVCGETTTRTDEDPDLWEEFVFFEFNEDSPVLRRKTHAFVEGVDELRDDLRSLVKSSAAYLDACGDEVTHSVPLACDLAKPEVRTISPLMARLEKLLIYVGGLKEVLLDSVHLNIKISAERFLVEEIKPVQELRRKLQRAREVHEALDSKYMHLRRTKHSRTAVSLVNVGKGKGNDAMEESVFAELQAAKARFELTRFALIERINRLENKKHFEFSARIAECMNDFFIYFREGYQRTAAECVAVQEARAGFALPCGPVTSLTCKQQLKIVAGKWNEKRVQLESQLHSGAFPFLSKERRKETTRKAPPQKVVVHSRKSRTSVDSTILFEGYLYKRNSSVRKDWKRRWFVLHGDRLLYFRGWKDPEPQFVCNILLSMVREVKAPEQKCCFEIISPHHRTYLLQASNDFEMQAWMDAIRKAIEANLTQQPSGPGGGRRPSLSRSSGLSDPDVVLLMQQNDKCADCGTKAPDWVSLNLGVVVCITCSGIHRSLGTHVSKVRSMALDCLPRSQLQLLRRLGNERVNALLEATMHSQHPPVAKPTQESCREEREHFMRQKYVDKLFLLEVMAKSDGTPANMNDIAELILGAVRENDLERLLELILFDALPVNHGGFLNTVPPAEVLAAFGLPAASTALHYAASLDRVECVELLLLNGAKLDVVDGNGETSLEIACRANQVTVFDVIDRYFQTGSRTSSGKGQASMGSTQLLGQSFQRINSAPNSPKFAPPSNIRKAATDADPNAVAASAVDVLRTAEHGDLMSEEDQQDRSRAEFADGLKHSTGGSSVGSNDSSSSEHWL